MTYFPSSIFAHSGTWLRLSRHLTYDTILEFFLWARDNVLTPSMYWTEFWIFRFWIPPEKIDWLINQYIIVGNIELYWFAISVYSRFKKAIRNWIKYILPVINQPSWVLRNIHFRATTFLSCHICVWLVLISSNKSPSWTSQPPLGGSRSHGSPHGSSLSWSWEHMSYHTPGLPS